MQDQNVRLESKGYWKGYMNMDGTTSPRYQVIYNGKTAEPTAVEKGYRQYCFDGSQGRGLMEVYDVFPGIELIYNDFFMASCPVRLESHGNLLEVNYCYEGREECEWVSGSHLYLGREDLCITRMGSGLPALCFPSGRYRGITVILDLDALRATELPIIGENALSLSEFPNKFCPDRHYFAMRADTQIAHIFSEFYRLPHEMRGSFFKIKILELLLFLSLVDPQRERRIEKITEGQIEVIKRVRERLCTDLRSNITIEQLAKEFGISPTALKKNFKITYHDSVKEYLRKVKMEQAAFLLRRGDETIAQIAEQLGYINQSKFAAAFKKVYGLTPTEYRKKCIH